MPLSAMLGVMPGTAIWVFPTGCAEEACAIGDDCDAEDAFLLPIGVGDIVVWRGDLCTRGPATPSPSTSECTRTSTRPRRSTSAEGEDEPVPERVGS